MIDTSTLSVYALAGGDLDGPIARTDGLKLNAGVTFGIPITFSSAASRLEVIKASSSDPDPLVIHYFAQEAPICTVAVGALSKGLANSPKITVSTIETSDLGATANVQAPSRQIWW